MMLNKEAYLWEGKTKNLIKVVKEKLNVSTLEYNLFCVIVFLPGRYDMARGMPLRTATP